MLAKLNPERSLILTSLAFELLFIILSPKSESADVTNYEGRKCLLVAISQLPKQNFQTKCSSITNVFKLSLITLINQTQTHFLGI